MNPIVRSLAQKGVALCKQAFGIDYYVLAKARYERSVIRKSKPKTGLHENGLSLFFQTELANSVGKTGRDFALKLARTDIPFSVVDTTPPWSQIERIPEGPERTAIAGLRSTTAHWRTSILLNGTDRTDSRDYDFFKEVFYEFGSGFNVYSPGFFRRVKRVCVFSDFCRDIVARAASEVGAPDAKIVKIRYPFLFPAEERMTDRRTIRGRVGIPEDAFAVFFNFSLAALPGRKNPDAAMRAFAEALGDVPNAWLVLKVSEKKGFESAMERLREQIASLGISERTRIVDTTLDMQEVLDLTGAMDVYLSLHRGEGLGLGMLEAMSLGVPVVATGYGGNMDFMSKTTSFPVPFSLRRWTPGCGFSKEMGEWAEPDIAKAAGVLRNIFANPTEAEKRAAAGLAFIRDFYSLENFEKDVRAFIDCRTASGIGIDGPTTQKNRMPNINSSVKP